MKLLITGATGFVGRKLVESLVIDNKHEVSILTRNTDRTKENFHFPVNIYEWNIEEDFIDLEAFKDIDVIIHLAGEGVANKKWSKSQKDRIEQSRVKGSELLIKGILKSKSSPKKVITASAIGFYGDRGNEELNHTSNKGPGFLSDVCHKWENSFRSSELKNLEVAYLRTGIVLGHGGGALEKMVLPFSLGLGGPLGPGKQYMSWIHIDDLINQYKYLIDNIELSGIFNGVSDSPVTNQEFTQVLGAVLNRPAVLKVPEFALKTLLGEMSTIVLASQRVRPDRFKELGFRFQYSELKGALNQILFHFAKNESLLRQFQWLPHKRENVFDFFAAETNLEKITPDFLNFKVVGKSTKNIEAGTLIDYKLNLKGLPFKWKTLIEKYEKNVCFVDTQLKGPYTKWHHTHQFYDSKEGTMMIDSVIYKIPFGLFGRVILSRYIRKDINMIFNYRRKIINEVYN